MQVSWNQYSKGYKRVKVKQVVDRGLCVYEGKNSLSRQGFINLQKKTLHIPFHLLGLLFALPLVVGVINGVTALLAYEASKACIVANNVVFVVAKFVVSYGSTLKQIKYSVNLTLVN